MFRRTKETDRFCVLPLYSDADVVIPPLAQTHRFIPCSSSSIAAAEVSSQRLATYGQIYFNENLFRLGLFCLPFRYYHNGSFVCVPVINRSTIQYTIKKNEFVGKMYIELHRPYIERLPRTPLIQCTAARYRRALILYPCYVNTAEEYIPRIVYLYSRGRPIEQLFLLSTVINKTRADNIGYVFYFRPVVLSTRNFLTPMHCYPNGITFIGTPISRNERANFVQ